MIRRATVFLTLLATLLASGCATLSEGQCLSADWYDLGFQDANRGHDSGRLADHRDACYEYGVQPDAQAYGAGFRDGLVTFCTPRSGFEFGLQGDAYGQTCPVALERDFLYGYRLGQDIHRSERELDTLAADIDDLEEALSEQEDEDERRRLRRRIDNLDQERARLRRHIDRLEDQARRL